MICPTCNGTGQVRDPDPVEPFEPIKKGPRVTHENGMCSCDGPPHPYARGWCPAGGPR